MRFLATLLLALCCGLAPAQAQRNLEMIPKSEDHLASPAYIPTISGQQVYRGASINFSARRASLNEDFQDPDAFPPAGWVIRDNGNGLAQSWRPVVLDGAETQFAAYSVFEQVPNGTFAEDYLITPRLRPALGDATLTFDAAEQFDDPFGSQYFVRVSTTGQNIADFTVTLETYGEADFPLYNPNESDFGLDPFTVDLSAYIGQDIYVAFVHVNNFGDSWILDNVTGPEVIPETVTPNCAENHVPVDGATNVSHATPIFTDWDPPSSGAAPSGYLFNLGTDPAATNIATNFQTASPGVNYTPPTLTPNTTYYWQVNPFNDVGTTTCTIRSFTTAPAPTVTTSSPAAENFDVGGATPQNWSVPVSATSGKPWFFVDNADPVGNGTLYGPAADRTTGTGFFAWFDDSGTAPAGAETALLSPVFDLSSFSTSRAAPPAAYFFWQNQGPDSTPGTFTSLAVDVSTDGGATFTPDVLTITTEATTWTEAIVDLSSFISSQVVLQFRAIETAGFTSDFAIDDFIIGDAAVVPVELTGFDAVFDGSGVVLNWATASETVNAGFEVQMRNKDVADFETLDFVEGAGTTTEAQAYSFRVADLMPGTYQFRLRQVDFDGAFEYSPEVEATVEVADTHLMSEAYPNPFARQTSFDLAVPEAQVVTAEVFNTVGQHVATLYDGALDANVTTQLALDAANLPSGLYVLRVTGETFQTTRKLTVSK
ncbi:MAG: choice-of-anchor J domain-containing protein [Bacteroidota bacterium]